MGYHECPIEPDDWAHGPSDGPGVECKTCEGTGEINDDQDGERTCPSCGGMGWLDPDPPEWDADD